MYKFIKYKKGYLLRIITSDKIYFDAREGKYEICKKNMDIIRVLTDIGEYTRPNIVDNYFLISNYEDSATKIFAKGGEKLLHELDFALNAEESHVLQNKNILFFHNKGSESFYYELTPETWAIKKIPYPNPAQYYKTSFGDYIVFKTKEEEWYVYKGSLDNLIWTADLKWASTDEYEGESHRYRKVDIYPYGTDRMILVYDPCNAFCINLKTGVIEWQNKMIGDYLMASEHIAYVNFYGGRVSKIDLRTGLPVSKRDDYYQLTPMGRYTRKYVPAATRELAYHDGYLWMLVAYQGYLYMGAYDAETYDLKWATELPGKGDLPNYIYFLEDYLYVRTAYGNLYVYQQDEDWVDTTRY